MAMTLGFDRQRMSGVAVRVKGGGSDCFRMRSRSS